MEDDGLPARPVKQWTPSKLALIAYYLKPFSEICRNGWYYLDAFAGNGANNAGQLGLFKGSALIGATQPLSATGLALIETDPVNVSDLRTRIHRVRPDALILEGDCNERIGEALDHFDNRGLPGFCVLDPEGLEMSWEVIEVCAGHRERGTPYELLVYFSTPGAMRVASVTDRRMVERNEEALRRVFGGDAWLPVAEKQRAGVLDGTEAGREYLGLYEQQLRELGYRHVMSRPAFAHAGDRGLVYHLVFASSDDKARKIMSQGLERAFAGQLPMQF